MASGSGPAPLHGLAVAANVLCGRHCCCRSRSACRWQTRRLAGRVPRRVTLESAQDGADQRRARRREPGEQHLRLRRRGQPAHGRAALRRATAARSAPQATTTRRRCGTPRPASRGRSSARRTPTAAPRWNVYPLSGAPMSDVRRPTSTVSSSSRWAAPRRSRRGPFAKAPALDVTVARPGASRAAAGPPRTGDGAPRLRTRRQLRRHALRPVRRRTHHDVRRLTVPESPLCASSPAQVGRRTCGAATVEVCLPHPRTSPAPRPPWRRRPRRPAPSRARCPASSCSAAGPSASTPPDGCASASASARRRSSSSTRVRT